MMARLSVQLFGPLTIFVAFLSFSSICAAAGATKVFSETWQDKWHCEKINGSTGCFELSGGKFTISFLIPQSAGTGTLPSTFTGESSLNFDLTLGDYSFQDTIGDFSVGKTGDTATESVSILKCVPKIRDHTSAGSTCTPFDVEKIALTLTKSKRLPALKVVITGTTGEISGVGSSPVTSIAAESFDGMASGKITDDIALEIDVGSWMFNGGGGSSGSAGADNVPVTGTITTKEQKEHGTSAATLSDIKVQGTLAAQ
jgi:hypothetical protein